MCPFIADLALNAAEVSRDVATPPVRRGGVAVVPRRVATYRTDRTDRRTCRHAYSEVLSEGRGGSNGSEDLPSSREQRRVATAREGGD
jgi:hypothetical protein